MHLVKSTNIRYQMKIRSKLLAAAFVAGMSLAGTSANAAIIANVYLNDAPPPPVYEEVEPRAGYTWVPGFYTWSAKRHNYVWHAGKWVVARPGQTWEADRWVQDENGWRRIEGHWNIAEVEHPVVVYNTGYKNNYRKTQYRDYDHVNKKHGHSRRGDER